MKKLLLLLLLATTAAHGETYKWTDSEGTVHFSESRAEIPAKYQKSAKSLGMNTTTGTPAAAAGTQKDNNNGSQPPDMAALKERMLQDERSMALIRALQTDPEIQALLNNPAVVRAVQAGDYSVLLNNPAFMKLLDNPRVKEIQKRMQ